MRVLATVPPHPARPARGVDDPLAHADALYNLARYLTRDPGEAEDLVQETYARALQARERYAPGSDLRAWLYRILRNAFLDRRRRERRNPTESGYDTVAESGLAAEEAPLRGDIELERMRRLVGEEIEQALLSLGADARTVVLLDLEGLAEAEIAMVMGCAVGTVKSRLSRARAALRQRLADYRR